MASRPPTVDELKGLWLTVGFAVVPPQDQSTTVGYFPDGKILGAGWKQALYYVSDFEISDALGSDILYRSGKTIIAETGVETRYHSPQAVTLSPGGARVNDPATDLDCGGFEECRIFQPSGILLCGVTVTNFTRAIFGVSVLELISGAQNVEGDLVGVQFKEIETHLGALQTALVRLKTSLIDRS